MKIKDLFTKMIITVLFSICIFPVIFIFSYIFIKGKNSINYVFLFELPKGIPQGSEGGIFPAIIGSILSMIISMVISSIFAVSTAVYNVFINNEIKLKKFISFMNRILAGIPSIIFGLFGYGILIVYWGINRSLLTMSLTLAIMIYPYIEINTERIFYNIDKQHIFDSKALGISNMYMTLKLVIPISYREIISTIILGGSYALGATAPVILTGAVLFSRIPKSIMDPTMVLPFHLHMLLSQSISKEKAYGTALVLIIILGLINIIAFLISKDWRNKNVKN